MKKVLGILAVLFMLSGVSMAATMSDADLAGVTGQAGVTIEISNLNMYMNLGCLTYGDLDGFTGATDAGFVNVAFYPAPLYIGMSGLTLTIDVGTDTAGTGRTYVNIATSLTQMNIYAAVVDIYLNSYDGVHNDFTANIGTPYVHNASTMAGASVTDSIGRIGISQVQVVLAAPVNIKISAH